MALAVAVISQSALPAAASGRPADPLPHVARLLAQEAPLRVVAFGSSSTQGVGASGPQATYPSRLAGELAARLSGGVEVLNRGIGGEDAEDMARRMPAMLAEHPDLVVWQTGSNDPLRGVPLTRFVDLTRAGIAAIREAGADVMLMEPQLCARLAAVPGADRYRDAVREIGSEMGVPVIRRFDLMEAWLAEGLVTRVGLLSPDGLHMADAGYALLAREVAREILEDTHPVAGVSAALR